jgi:DNA-binding GntR family transcriptional regulator
MNTHRKKDLVHTEILDRLLDRQYVFGDRISVSELGEAFGVSRQPIMSALNALSSEGFVTVTAQVGCEVVAPSRTDIADFFLMFGRLEGVIAELAAERRTEDELAILEDINNRISALTGSGPSVSKRYRHLNLDFHNQLHAMAHSDALHARQAQLFAMSDFLIVQTCGFAVHVKDASDEHNGILSALQQRKPAKARVAAEQHITQVAAAVDAYLERTVKALLRA